MIEDIKSILKNVLDENYWEGYKEAVNNYNSILRHSKKGIYPRELFDNRAPNQTEEESEWLKANYKQISLPVFNSYMNNRGRTWHKNNWSVEYAVQDSRYENQSFEQYVNNSMRGVGSLQAYAQHILPAIKARDAEGILVVKPESLPIEYLQTEEGITTRFNDQQLIEPQVYYYDCTRVVAQEQGVFYMVLVDEKSLVLRGKKQVREGRIFELYTKEAIYTIAEKGKAGDNEFSIKTFWNHGLNFLPCAKLMGVPNVVNNKTRWQSHFLPAVDALDLMLLDVSNLSMAKSKSVYPFRIMAADECEHIQRGVRCSGGRINFFDKEAEKERSTVCSGCNGTGMKNRITPMGEMLFDPKDREDNGRDLVSYVAPDITTLEFLQSQIDAYEYKARRVVHAFSESVATEKNKRTATEVSHSHKSKIAFIKDIANQEFYLYEFLLTAIGLQRYGIDFVPPVVNRPNSYDLTTEQDYIDKIARAKAAGVPPISLRFILTSYIKGSFADSAKQSKIIDLIIATDRILELNNEEIEVKRLSGSISGWEDIIHCSGMHLIEELLLEDSEFFNRSFVDQKQLLIGKAKLVSLNNEQDIDLTTEDTE